MIYLGKFKAGDTVRYRANFHNDTGTLENPTSPEAQIEKPDASFTALTAPAIINAKTGHYGGSIDTTGFAVGQHLIRMAGTVATAKTVATEFCFTVVANIESDTYAIVNHTDYGNAKLVRSTTPGNALDVSATGEAGLDFNNIKDASAPKTLTNITVPTVTDITTKTGYALSAAGIQAIWDALTSALVTAGSVGKKLADWVLGSDSKVILSNNAHTGATIPVVTSITNGVTVATNSDKTGYSIAGTKTTLDALNDITAANVWAVATRTITGGTIDTNGDKTGYRLSATGVDDIHDETIEGTLTWRQITRLCLSAFGGKSSGGGSPTLAFRDNADAKNRITATVDANGNRTAVTLDGA